MRRAIALVALLNLGYFFVEFAVAQSIGSVSLFADSVDFLEDTAINLLILLAAGWSVSRRSRVGVGLAALLLLPGTAALWTAWQSLSATAPPDPFLLSATGLGALLINLLCAALLVQYRRQSGSLVRAAWLSARNDALANVGILMAAGLTVLTQSIWPDLIAGLLIFAINLDAAQEVYSAARREGDQATEEHHDC